MKSSSNQKSRRGPRYISDLDYDDNVDWLGLIKLFKTEKKPIKYFLLATLLLLGSAGFLMLSAKNLGALFGVIAQKKFGSEYILLASVFLGAEAISLIFQYYGRIIIAYSTTQVTLGTRKKLIDKINSLPVAYFDSTPMGRTLTRITADVEGLEQFFSGTLPKVLSAVVQIIAVFIAMLLSNLKLGLIVVCFTTPAIFFSVFLRVKARAVYREIKRLTAGLNAKLAENISGLTLIRLFGLSDWTLSEYRGGTNSLYRSHLKLMNLNAFVMPTIVLLCTAPLIFVFGFGGNYVLSGSLELATFVAFVRYSERILSPVRAFSQEIQVIQDALASSERIYHMLNEPPETSVLGEDGHVQQELAGKIEFSHVFASYGRPEKPILKNISFRIGSGEKVGLVGATGSGKTTTISLIPALYQIDEGVVLIDDIPLNHWHRETLRQQIGYISQDVEIFRGSLRDNLLVGRSAHHFASDQEILNVCALTGFEKTLNSLPKGLDQILLDGGKNLSVGERQLLSITRIILKNPKILILDEATSSIDPHSEKIVQEALNTASLGRTTLIIAHRLSTVTACDLILVFHDGKLIEKGTHEQLVKNDGYYAQLARTH